MKNIAVLLFISLMAFSCGSSPEASDNQKTKQVAEQKKKPAAKKKAKKNERLDFTKLTKTDDRMEVRLGKLNNMSTGKKRTFTVSAKSDLTINGWAINLTKNIVGGDLYVLLNRAAYDAKYGFERPDVVEYKGKKGLLKSGFSLTIPAKKLTPGKYELSYRLVSKDRKSYAYHVEKEPITIFIKE